jgi:hypothetical protein
MPVSKAIKLYSSGALLVPKETSGCSRDHRRCLCVLKTSSGDGLSFAG